MPPSASSRTHCFDFFSKTTEWKAIEEAIGKCTGGISLYRKLLAHISESPASPSYWSERLGISSVAMTIALTSLERLKKHFSSSQQNLRHTHTIYISSLNKQLL